MYGDQMSQPDKDYRPEEECDHRNMGVLDDAEGDMDEAHLTRHFTIYDCPDCAYCSESPPIGWEAPFEEPEIDYSTEDHYR